MCTICYVYHIPYDYQERLLEAHRKLEVTYGDVQEERANLENRLKWGKRLFEFSDYARRSI